MNARERNLAILLLGLVVVFGGGVLGYFFVYEPIRQKNAAAEKLEGEVAELTKNMDRAKEVARRGAMVRRQSLPPDETIARREYSEMMSRLLRQANVPPGFSINPKPVSDSKTIPLLAGKKPAYTKIVTDIEFKKADMWAVMDFLTGYYKLNLLHQITAISIKKDDEAVNAGGRPRTAGDRHDLTVKLTTEAIILDGAENRRTLLPPSNAFSAVGGLAGFNALSQSPEVGRGLTPIQFNPVLSTKNRDYTMIVLRDLFNGPLPSIPPMRLDKIGDLTAEVDKPITPVKVPILGDIGYIGEVKLTVTTDSKIFPTGSIKIDQKTKSIALLPVPGELGTAEFSVFAKAENGQEAKSRFKVSIKEPEVVKEALKEDISAAIKLVIAGTRSDGTGFATIRDSANRYIYEIEADRRRIRITKYFYNVNSKKKDPFYDTPQELLISDEFSGTNRTFKVIGMDSEGLVLVDLKPDAKAAAKTVKGAAPGKGGFPVRPGRLGPAEPIAGVAGGFATAVPPPSGPVVYRWASGKSLSGLTPVPKDEAKKIIDYAELRGPVNASPVSTPAN